jgi:predicted HTH domain antitoxin
MYDPCGSRRLDGDDIIKRLAEYLNVNPVDLEKALREESIKWENVRLFNNPKLDGGCGCGD